MPVTFSRQPNPRVKTTRVPKPGGLMPRAAEDTSAGEQAAGGFTVSLDFGSGGGGGGKSVPGAAAAITTSYKAAQDKAAAKRARKQADYIRGLLSGTGYRAPIDEMLGKVATEETRQLGDITSLYGTAGTAGAPGTGLRGDITTAYGTAQGQVTAGYDALKKWLGENAPKAYAEARRATPVDVTNALAAYQAAQGVSTAPTDAAVQMLNTAAAGGAQNYNTLLDTLAAAAKTAQESRMAEEQMARTTAGTGLTAAQTAALARLAAQQAQAEAGVRGQFGQTRLSAEQAAISRRQALEDALRALVGY